MKAYITSIGESTTTLCFWSLKRLGFEPILIRDSNTTLWEKLKVIYNEADGDFIRVDADVVCNSNILELAQQKEGLWYQSLSYGWFKQDVIHGGVQFYRKEAIPIVLKHIEEAKDQERPETFLSRLPEFYNPRSFLTFEKICGIHGYKQKDIARIEETKKRRGVWGDYDWDLALALEQL